MSTEAPPVRRRRSATGTGSARKGAGSAGKGTGSAGKGTGSTAKRDAPAKGLAPANGSSNDSGGSTAPKRVARFAVRPATDGPRIRLGILWFFLALAAVTAGRWPAAILWGLVGAAAARELLGLWWPLVDPSGDPQLDAPPPGVGLLAPVLVLVVAASAALGTGIVGVALVVVAGGAGAAFVAVGPSERGARLERGHVASFAVAVLLPAVTVAAVVLVVGAHLWAGLFLVAAVSLYDAGFFVGGAESSSLVEGPVTGIVGILAVTFAMAMFQAPPFNTGAAVVVGVACAVACPVGQWLSSACLPAADVTARGVRRLDTYVVAAPVFLAASWALA